MLGAPRIWFPVILCPIVVVILHQLILARTRRRKNEGCQDHQRLTILSKNQEILWIIPSPTTGKGILWGMAGARCNVVWIRRGAFVWTLLGGTID